MSDKPSPYREGMQAFSEGQTERQNPYRYGSTKWSRWQAGHRYARQLVEDAQSQELRILQRAWSE